MKLVRTEVSELDEKVQKMKSDVAARASFVFSEASWRGVWPKGMFAIAEPKVFTSDFIIEEKKYG